jgi:hypothetical protein
LGRGNERQRIGCRCSRLLLQIAHDVRCQLRSGDLREQRRGRAGQRVLQQLLRASARDAIDRQRARDLQQRIGQRLGTYLIRLREMLHRIGDRKLAVTNTRGHHGRDGIHLRLALQHHPVVG